VKKWERKLATEASAVHLSVFAHRRWEAKPFISGPDEHLLETHIEPISHATVFPGKWKLQEKRIRFLINCPVRVMHILRPIALPVSKLANLRILGLRIDPIQILIPYRLDHKFHSNVLQGFDNFD
jgi:hypothetical protein